LSACLTFPYYDRLAVAFDDTLERLATMLAAIMLCFALLSFGQEAAGQARPQHASAPPQATPAASPTAQGPAQSRGPQERPSPSPEDPPVIMMYIDDKSHARLRADIGKFIQDSMNR